MVYHSKTKLFPFTSHSGFSILKASSLLVLTTGRQYCQRFLQGPSALPELVLLSCPVDFPKMVYYQLWHERSHTSMAGQWLREQVKISAAQLPKT